MGKRDARVSLDPLCALHVHIVSTVDCIRMNASDWNFIFNYGDS